MTIEHRDWTGFSRELDSEGNAQFIYDLDHIRAAIEDILQTPKGSRLMRPEYGSDLFLLLDNPVTKALLLDIYAESIDAVARWEPRLRVVRAHVGQIDPGMVLIDFVAIYQGAEVEIPGVAVRAL